MVGMYRAPVQVADLQTPTQLVAGHPGPVELGMVARLPEGQVLGSVLDRGCRAAHLLQPNVVIDHPEAPGGSKAGALWQ